MFEQFLSRAGTVEDMVEHQRRRSGMVSDGACGL